MLSTVSLAFLLLSSDFSGVPVQALTSYANDFIQPSYLLSANYGDSSRTSDAQLTITGFARDVQNAVPWSVVNKTVMPPSGDKHDYLSWAPYSWPNCTSVGNKTELTPEEVWTTCPYYTRDGVFNPDARMVDNIGAFSNLSDAVFYSAIAHATTGSTSSVYSRAAVNFIKTWFLDEETMMNPNVKYAQLARGPDGQVGQHTGVLDLKGLVKIANGIAIFRDGNCTDWTDEMSQNMTSWVNEYITYLETYPTALREGAALNNHGSFYYSQLAACKIIVGDIAGATNVTNTYFHKQFLTQIVASGEQPLEAARTRPYHYRAYNLAAMITNARLLEYSNGTSAWNLTTNGGATIQTALDWAMTFSPNATNEQDYASELYPSVAAVASTYGDPDGKYAAFLQKVEPHYAAEAFFLWDQPLVGGYNGSYSNSQGTSKHGSDNGAIRVGVETYWMVIAGALLASVLNFLFAF